MYVFSLCFISTACFSAFYRSPYTNIENFNFFLTLVCVFFLASMQLYSSTYTIEKMLLRQDNSMAMIWWLDYIKCNLFFIS